MSILIFVGVLFIFWLLDPTVIYMCNEFGRMAGSDAESAFMISTLLQSCWSIGGFIFAFLACFKWRKHKAAKKAAEVAASEVPSPQPDPEPTIAAPASPAPATPKLRYCKHCGSPIDPTTRQCTGCGKQYFRPPVLHKKHLYIGAGVLACAVVVFLVFNLVFQKNTALSKVDQLTAQITELENTIAEKDRQIEIYKRNEEAYQVKLTKKGAEYDKLRTENTELKSEISAMNYEISFYDRHIVFVADDGTKKYHNYSCEYLDLSYFWAYNVEAARDRGYKPCSHCCD